MRVIVCGGRLYSDRKVLFDFMDQLLAKHEGEDFTVIQGGAAGADYYARCWAVDRCVAMIIKEANWKLHGKSAGPIRNCEMLKYSPDLVVAFPGGKGTANMVEQARRANVSVVEVE